MATVTLEVAIEHIHRLSEMVVRKVALDVAANLRARPDEGGTPVDTGWARANWIPRIAEEVSAPIGTRPDRSAGQSGVLVEDVGADAAIAEVATGYKIDFGPIYVSNAVPYIVELNEGSSQQAPAGFVQAAIVKALTRDIQSLESP